jgi:hypothetical protein
VSKGSRQNRSVSSGKGLALKVEVSKLESRLDQRGFWLARVGAFGGLAKASVYGIN